VTGNRDRDPILTVTGTQIWRGRKLKYYDKNRDTGMTGNRDRDTNTVGVKDRSTEM
jgi:hypothetical protein